MLVLAIDPGITTGVCLVNTVDGTVNSQQLSGVDTSAFYLVGFIDQVTKQGRVGEVIVVVEDFIGSGRRDEDIKTTIKLLGFIELECLTNGIKLVKQVPQYRNPFLDKAIESYPLHKHRHCADAFAHALCFIITGGIVENGKDYGTGDSNLKVYPCNCN